MATVKLQPITLRQAELAENESRLYVLNRSKEYIEITEDDPKSDKRGEIVRKQPVAANINFTVTENNGTTNTLTIPATSIPIDLSNYAQRSQILPNPYFRRLVQRGYIVLVDNDEADRLFEENPRARAERDRIYGVINTDVDLSNVDYGGGADGNVAEKMGVQASNPFIQTLVNRSKTEEAADLISDMDARMHNLTPADVEYVAKYAHNSQLKDFALDALQEMDAPA